MATPRTDKVMGDLYRRQLHRYNKLLTAQIRLCKRDPSQANINERTNLENAVAMYTALVLKNSGT